MQQRSFAVPQKQFAMDELCGWRLLQHMVQVH